MAVRSSATAEDLPDASFAGQQATFLNVSGERDVLQAVHDVYASLFTDRAIAYRAHNKFDHALVGISVGIQRMVRSDLGASGVMFTLDTDSGFRDVVFITSAYGLGETVVQGAVNPDEFYVYKPALAAGRKAVLRRNLGAKAIKMVYAQRGAAERVATVEVPAEQRQRFSLTDAELEELARQAVSIEQHYGCPMDIEWAKDGDTSQLFIVQARPETVQSQNRRTLQRFALKGKSKVLAEGRSIGQKIAAGRARFVASAADIERVQSGDVLVADMTDPDWEPIMKRAAAIVTRRGGRTCHAAIIARELGVPAVVGCGDSADAHPRRPRRHRVVRRGRDRLRVRRRAGVRSPGNRARHAAERAREDHDERRQPGPGVRLRRAAEPGRGARAARVHRESHDRRASAGAARVRPPRRGAETLDPPPDGGLRGPHHVLRRASSPRVSARSRPRSRRTP